MPQPYRRSSVTLQPKVSSSFHIAICSIWTRYDGGDPYVPALYYGYISAHSVWSPPRVGPKVRGLKTGHASGEGDLYRLRH